MNRNTIAPAVVAGVADGGMAHRAMGSTHAPLQGAAVNAAPGPAASHVPPRP